MKTLNFFFACLKMTVSREMVYKFNFIIRMFTLMSFDLIFPFITILIYLRTNGFPGWSFYEIVLFQGVFIMINSIDRMFFQGVDWELSANVRSGVFDRYLLFPVNTLAYLSFTNFMLDHIGDFVIGIILIIYASIKLSIAFSISSILGFMAFILLAIIFIITLELLKYSLVVRAVRIGRIGEFFRTMKTFGQNPVNIYNTFLSSIFRYIVPLALLAYYPSKILLDNYVSNFTSISLVVLANFLLSSLFWKNTLKSYTSAGG